jgi:hypothetical protein
MREFARYDLGDYPIFILQPEFQAVVFSAPDINNPEFRFTEHSLKEDQEYRFFEYPLMGHNFILPTSKSFYLVLNEYLLYLKKERDRYRLKEINTVFDIDFTFSYLKS